VALDKKRASIAFGTTLVALLKRGISIKSIQK
jgi:hypothetical protein